MKKYILLTTMIVSLIAISCKKNFLDPKIVNTLNTEAGTFADSARTIMFVNNIYNNIGWAFNVSRFNGGGNLAGATDEAANRDLSTSNQANLISQTTLTATTIGSGSSLLTNDDRGYWYVYWIPIRAANIALADIPSSPLPDALKKRLMGEARFLRAFYYSTLMKYYGGLPLIGDTVFLPGANPDMPPRSSFDATVKYITSECDSAAALLYDGDQSIVINGAQIFDGPGADNGRATKGACMALKARVLLYAASPLFNGGNVSTDLGSAATAEITGYTSVDPQRWKLAADAAEWVISTNKFALRVDNSTAPGYGFYSVFVTRPVQPIPEFIFSVMSGNNKGVESAWDPPSRGGSANMFPYQELVDAFPMNNGKPITDQTSGYDPNNPYTNRDPRFNFTILHNESLRYLQSAGTATKVFTYVKAQNDGYNFGTSSTNTGYYSVKMADDKGGVTGAGPNLSPRCLPLIRYAETILSAAEATNEFSGPGPRVYQLMGMIRQRAGIIAGANGLYGIPAGIDKPTMRLIIQNERRIEFAFEDQRIWDMHRWKIAAQVMAKTQHGVQITPVAGGGYTYNYFVANTTYWKTPFYLFPISQYEIARNPKMLQNPGW